MIYVVWLMFCLNTNYQILSVKMMNIRKIFWRNVVVAVILLFFLSQVTSEKEPVEEESRTDTIKNGDKTEASTLPPAVGNLGFVHAFVASISVIIVSELGDKTFFIAAIMAMRHPRLTVFAGAMAALAFMTILSAVFGWVATVIPRAYTYYISTALFAIFGLKMLKDGYYMSPNEGQEELEEVQSELRKREDEYENESRTAGADLESGARRTIKTKTSVVSFISRIFIQAFTLTFLAEWGDRSQLTTIILAAREDVVGVTAGGIAGHGFCTGLAVLGGRLIAQRISVRTVTIIGGVVFLFFAVSSLFLDPNTV